MSEFTPGPWIETGDSNWHPDRYEGGGSASWTVVRSDSADIDVAIVMVDARWGSDERLDANARLIAAAPDLYEALAGMVLAPDGLGCVDAAISALAKARGE